MRALNGADLPPDKKAAVIYALATTLKAEARMAGTLALLATWDPANGRFFEHAWGRDFVRRLMAARGNLQSEAASLFDGVASKYGDLPKGAGGTYGAFARGGAFAVRNLALGKPVPDFVGTNAEGRPVRLSELRGKVVFLDFWFVGCAACRAEFPHFREIHDRYAGKPLAIVGISAEEDRAVWEKFLKKERLPWVQWYSGGRVIVPWNITIFPTHYVIDHHGIIRDADMLSFPALDRLLDQLVREAAESAGKR